MFDQGDCAWRLKRDSVDLLRRGLLEPGAGKIDPDTIATKRADTDEASGRRTGTVATSGLRFEHRVPVAGFWPYLA